jgi:hypothetical protein
MVEQSKAEERRVDERRTMYQAGLGIAGQSRE